MKFLYMYYRSKATSVLKVFGFIKFVGILWNFDDTIIRLHDFTRLSRWRRSKSSNFECT